MYLNKNCRKCGTKLTINNIFNSLIKQYSWICKDCFKEYSRNYIKENFEYLQNYRRNHVLGTGKGCNIHGITKRTFTGFCEICNIKGKVLKYHHWDDADLVKGKVVKGVWVCHACHYIVEAADQIDKINKYLSLKREIECSTSNGIMLKQLNTI